MNEQLLKELGLDKAAAKLGKQLKLKQKLAIAYEHFRFVEPHIFDRFQKEVKTKTLKVVEACPQCKNMPLVKLTCWYCQKTGARQLTHDTLAFIKLEEYQDVPPMDCLMDLKKAKDLECFDRFEVAKVETVEVRPDPIIFGIIEGCDDYFYITQWDNDVAIEQILNEGEG